MTERVEVAQKLLGSDAKLEILALFHQNPGLVDRIDGVGRRLGRDVEEIKAEVKDLIDIGVLHTEILDSSQIIYYDERNDAKIQKEISYRLMNGP